MSLPKNSSSFVEGVTLTMIDASRMKAQMIVQTVPMFAVIHLMMSSI